MRHLFLELNDLFIVGFIQKLTEDELILLW